MFKRIQAGRLIPCDGSEQSEVKTPEQLASYSAALSKFSNDLRSERLDELPTIDFGNRTELIKEHLTATGRSDFVWPTPDCPKVGTFFKTAWGTVIHIDDVRYSAGYHLVLVLFSAFT